MVDKTRLFESFLALLEVNSPSFYEHELGGILTEWLRAVGAEVYRQDYGRSFNLIARVQGTLQDAPPLILSAHMDTIEPTEGLRYEVDSNLVRSVGDTVLGADDKSGLAATIEALRIIKERDLPTGDLEIVFTSGEEKGTWGAKNLDFSLIRGRHAIVLDVSGRTGTIVKKAPTHITYRMVIQGTPAHAGIEPEKGLSAIRMASEIINSIPDGRIDENTTANIGRITGGTATNVVPREVVIEGEVRSHIPDRLNEIKHSIFSTGRAVAEKYQGSRVEITENEEYRGYTIDESDPFFRFLLEKFTETGITPKVISTGGGSDANIFNRRGIRAVNIATGMEMVHSREEYIHVQDLIKVTGLLVAATVGFAAYDE